MSTVTIGAVGGNWTTGGTWVGMAAPTAADDAIGAGASGSATVDAGAVARSFDCTSGLGTYAGTLTHSAGVTLTIGDGTAGAGNVAFKLTAGMTYTLGSGTTSALSFVSTSATQQSITMAGKIAGNTTFNGVGGSWLLSDAFAGGSMVMTLTNGALAANNIDVTVLSFSSSNSNTRTLTMGTGQWVMAGTSGTLWDCGTSTNLTVTPGSSTIIFTDNGASDKTFAGGGKTYGTFQIGGGGAGAVIITGGNTFATLAISPPKTVKFTDGTTTTITGSFTATGSSGNVITLNTDTGSGTWTISKASGVVSCDWLNLTNSTATGGATFYAGANSTDGGGNTGWIFSAAPASSGVQQLTMLGVG